MQVNRRKFINTALVGGVATALPFTSCNSDNFEEIYKKLDNVVKLPILKTKLFSDAVIIESIDLLEYKNNFLCRVRSKDGAEGFSFGNSSMNAFYPIFTKRIKPYFLGKDARNLEALLDEVYVYKSNYKLQSTALWVPVATLEFAILDLLGRIAGKPMGELIGEIHNPEIKLYQANSKRGISAEETMDQLLKQLDVSKAEAVKFKVGGRMSAPEFPKGRSEKLIPLVRKTLGDDMVISADSNGSYDVNEAIRIGKIMEEHNFDFYEEPVPFDWYEETKQVADALEVPIAGGEQEGSMRNFRWLLGNDAIQVLQADMFYFGGMIRSMKVARMANVLGKVHTPHVSNIGYVYMLHFVSALPNAGKYHEFKSPFNKDMSFECKTSSLLPENGKVKVPTDPGLGIDFEPGFINKHKIVE
ncbi:mandelate racemase/muconate lactonizing enzyme family protein [uncultured Draconibacterium sp.]|uniref:mandelate racemase/muconate lactonizing enzyme family protein n=1 Tax=uncultured Draconibacterium sp. TaxID=1573823 RepID=UPI0025D56CE7|nr:mandelate racemase/muconate lactonizing enzyme family protein [uncultured Draconibacterium sp.]